MQRAPENGESEKERNRQDAARRCFIVKSKFANELAKIHSLGFESERKYAGGFRRGGGRSAVSRGAFPIQICRSLWKNTRLFGSREGGIFFMRLRERLIFFRDHIAIFATRTDFTPRDLTPTIFLELKFGQLPLLCWDPWRRC